MFFMFFQTYGVYERNLGASTATEDCDGKTLGRESHKRIIWDGERQREGDEMKSLLN